MIVYWDGELYIFIGCVDGKIVMEFWGSGGFGFDLIFIFEGFDRMFVEMIMEEKNCILYCGRVLREFVNWLKENFK